MDLSIRKSTLSGADLLSVEEYIDNRKNTITEYAENSGIYKKCINAENISSNSNILMWYKQRIIKSNEAEISYMESDQAQ